MASKKAAQGVLCKPDGDMAVLSFRNTSGFDRPGAIGFLTKAAKFASFARLSPTGIVETCIYPEIGMSSRSASLALACAIPLAMIALCGHADEQGSAIDHCAAIGNPEQRIRCLEDAIRQLSGHASSAPDTTANVPAAGNGTAGVPESSSAGPMPRSSAPPGMEAAAAGGAATEALETLPTQQRTEPNPASAADLPRIDSMGSEQLPGPENAATDQPDARVTVQVVAFDFVGRNKLRVRLVNGQVWRQIDADRGDFQAMLRNQEGFEVELWQTGLGGYRMRILPTSKTVRVQRLK
jgi:hypothetical protein